MTARQNDAHELEKELGLPSGFCNHLLADDDWSFVIKLHALFESATTHVLARTLGKPELEGPLAHIEMSNKKSGKVAIGKTLGLFDSDVCRFLYTLSELRNSLVHRVGNTSFTFHEHLQSLDAPQRKNFNDSFGFALDDPIQTRDNSIPRNMFIENNPKTTMWHSAIEILSMLYWQNRTAHLQKSVSDLQRLIAEQALNEKPIDPSHAP